MNIWHIYEVLMSPTPNRSSAIWHFKDRNQCNISPTKGIWLTLIINIQLWCTSSVVEWQTLRSSDFSGFIKLIAFRIKLQTADHIEKTLCIRNTKRLGGVLTQTLACSLTSQTQPTPAWISFSISVSSLCMILSTLGLVGSGLWDGSTESVVQKGNLS